MDEVVAEDPENMSACAYCGVFRRDILARRAAALGADKLLTSHNLDDEAETVLMNILAGDITQIAKHFDGGRGERTRGETGAFVPRAKPLRDVPEKGVALFAHLRDLPAHITECPHAEEAYRGEIQELLCELEERHPGTRHSIMAGYEELAGLAAAEHRGEGGEFGECERCGGPTRGTSAGSATFSRHSPEKRRSCVPPVVGGTPGVVAAVSPSG